MFKIGMTSASAERNLLYQHVFIEKYKGSVLHNVADPQIGGELCTRIEQVSEAQTSRFRVTYFKCDDAKKYRFIVCSTDSATTKAPEPIKIEDSSSEREENSSITEVDASTMVCRYGDRVMSYLQCYSGSCFDSGIL